MHYGKIKAYDSETFIILKGTWVCLFHSIYSDEKEQSRNLKSDGFSPEPMHIPRNPYCIPTLFFSACPSSLTPSYQLLYLFKPVTSWKFLPLDPCLPLAAPISLSPPSQPNLLKKLSLPTASSFSPSTHSWRPFIFTFAQPSSWKLSRVS